jgi:hypothetical protein
LQIKKQGWRQFLQDQWNVINTINLCLFMAIIALRVTSINMYKDIMSKRPSPSVYIDYTAITAVVAQEYNLNAVSTRGGGTNFLPKRKDITHLFI